VSGVSVAGRAPWLGGPELRTLLETLSEGGEEARVAGGAVRNALLGEPVSDVDIATTVLPEETIRRAKAAGFKPVPTGIEHGTVTVVAGGKPYEVTTLRADIETDGRRAKVRFGRDWLADAERRDFTINAFYADADGTVIDLVGGLADIESRTIRFIGDADRRIKEDYLRILRFFRFFAWYGRGRPDADGLRACARLKEGLDGLSAERVWTELKKLLAAPDPSRALLWMRQASVLSRVLPESEKWGIDAIHGLVAAEAAFGWTPDPLLRLQAIVPPDPARMEALARRLKFSRAEGARLTLWAMAEAPRADVGEAALARALYRGDANALRDRLRHAAAVARARVEADPDALDQLTANANLLRFAEDWKTPRFPLAGADLVALELKPGPELGKLLARLENEWVDSGFRLSREELLEKAGAASGEG
jgi:tRNA nucleotidyltransferase/poly(A) polymerase